MMNALIGHTGFVGSNLLRQANFEGLFNSKNISEIRGQSFDTLVCSGARAEKWKANQAPEADFAHVQALMDDLATVKTKRAILISTIDVYPAPVEVDEDTAIAADRHHAYGKHRFLLEGFFRDRFPTLVVRLPGLFGHNLKKNAIYDFLNDNQTEKINSKAVFQFYSLDWLWKDIAQALNAGIETLNLATEPTSMAEVAREGFGFEFSNVPEGQVPARYDFRSKHAALWNGSSGYLYDKKQVLGAIASFVKGYRA